MNCIEIGGKQVVAQHDPRNTCHGCTFQEEIGGCAARNTPDRTLAHQCYVGSFIWVEVNHNSMEVK